MTMHYIAGLKIGNNLERLKRFIFDVTVENNELFFIFHDYYINSYKT